MNKEYFYSEEFMKTDTYKKFIENNPEQGILSIKASAAGGAIPISGVKIEVSKELDNKNIIFFEGETDSSGLIRRIELPAPTEGTDDLIAPPYTKYNIKATCQLNNKTLNYIVNIYKNIHVLQNINIVPNINERKNNIYGG